MRVIFVHLDQGERCPPQVITEVDIVMHSDYLGLPEVLWPFWQF